tara:strand:+ start:10502 stop:10708 length:207 start_codon:yes stop_codon:yes gene_type:complete
MIWNPKNKAETMFKEVFQTKVGMAEHLKMSRQTLDTYLSKPDLMNSQIKKIAKLTNKSELQIFKAINN